MKIPPLASHALLPLSWLYRCAVSARNLAYTVGLARPFLLDAAVISVGNITVGGTGKTPMVMYLAQNLLARGKNVGILSRGYRGRAAAEPGARNEDQGRSAWSDETWMLRRALGPRVRIGVGAERLTHALALRKEGIDWFLLDDGFQHRQLARDVDIVLVDSLNPFGNGRLLPSGPLREPLSSLSRADIIVITRSGDHAAAETQIRKFTSAPIFHAGTDLKEVVPSVESLERGDSAAWLGKNVFAFCAIGNGDAFFHDIQRWGMTLKGQLAFRDHHRYTVRDVQEIERRASEAGAELLLCTDKDTFNLQRTKFSHLPLYVCRITMKIEREREFWVTLSAVLEKKQAGQAK